MGFEVDVLIENLPQALDKSALVHKIGNIFSRLILKDKIISSKKKNSFLKNSLKNN
jgi:hypothetical protein